MDEELDNSEHEDFWDCGHSAWNTPLGCSQCYKEENDRLKATLLKFRDLIEFGPFFGVTATMLVSEADELLNPTASYDPYFRAKIGYWVPKVECKDSSVYIRALEREGL